MRQITEQQILAFAPNPAAAANGRKLSQKDSFVRRERSADDTFYLGECTGSGKNNYITTADFLTAVSPVFRCSCPSRQFPCKHSLALLYEILAQKNFAVCEIPEDIIKKREKKQARDAKAKETKESAEAIKPPSVSKAAKTARAKKWKKQLEGLELVRQMVFDLVNAGVGTIGGTALPAYRQLSKQLGDYYLPGPQRLLNRLTLEIEAFQKDADERHYETAIDTLQRLWALVKQAKQYLTDRLEADRMEQEPNPLYEELGGIWKLSELAAAGNSKKDRELIQAAFWVVYDEARKEFIDTGCYVDLETGEVCLTHNYRPLKALKYVAQEDTRFGVMQVPEACFYPGEGNRRVRWEGFKLRAVTAGDLERLRSFANADLAVEAKTAKNYLKNALAAPMLLRLISYEEIGLADAGPVLRTRDGKTILLGDMPGLEATTERLFLLPDGSLLKGQILLGAFYYDKRTRRLMLKPVSIVTQTNLIRLLY